MSLSFQYNSNLCQRENMFVLIFSKSPSKRNEAEMSTKAWLRGPAKCNWYSFLHMFLFYCSDLSQLVRYEAVLECNVVQCPQRPRRGSDHQAASSRQHQAEVRIGSNVGRSTPPSSFLHLVLNSNTLQCNSMQCDVGRSTPPSNLVLKSCNAVQWWDFHISYFSVVLYLHFQCGPVDTSLLFPAPCT